MKVQSSPPPQAQRPDAAKPGSAEKAAAERAGTGQVQTPADRLEQARAREAEQQKIKDFAQGAGSSTQAGKLKELREVRFDHMTNEQKYDYLKALTEAKGGSWKTGDKEVNLVGIRAFADQHGDHRPDLYNDRIYACRMVNGKKEVWGFVASVDGGVIRDKGLKDQLAGGFGNTTHLADGFYQDCWRKGKVAGGDLGLRQSKPVYVHADGDNDGKIDARERGEALRSDPSRDLQFHCGEGSNPVGAASAGCQVIHADQFPGFQHVLNESPQQDFSYLLVSSDSLISDASPVVNWGDQQWPISDDGEGGIGRIRRPVVAYDGGIRLTRGL